MIRIILSFIGSLCPAILFNVEKRNLLWAGFGGTLGMLLNDRILAIYPGATLVSIFLGAAAVAVYSEVMARVRKTPSTIFSIPGIFPLVPGVDAYTTIQKITEGNYPEAVTFAVSTTAKASLIAFGILIVSAVFRKMKNSVKKTTA